MPSHLGGPRAVCKNRCIIKDKSAPFGVRSAWVQMLSLPLLTDVDLNLLTYLTSPHLYHCTSKVESISPTLNKHIYRMSGADWTLNNNIVTVIIIPGTAVSKGFTKEGPLSLSLKETQRPQKLIQILGDEHQGVWVDSCSLFFFGH